MNLQTQIPLKKANYQITYDSQLLSLGSCFAENIGKKLEYYKFRTFQNAFGILFHPLAIEQLISGAIREDLYSESDIFFLNGLWHCFDAHSELSDTSKERLLEKLNNGLTSTRKHIVDASHIIITLGTAWVYRHLDSGGIVANCHKVPQNEFSKELVAVPEILNSLKRIKQLIQSINADVQIMYTVSPVRHLKDGFVENQRSKSHLLASIHQLLDISSLAINLSYFPSYELLMDELRDYRFYERDMVHPNQLAIDYIWEKFVSVWISDTVIPTMDEVNTAQRGMMHRPFQPNSTQHLHFRKMLDLKIASLKLRHPFMKF